MLITERKHKVSVPSLFRPVYRPDDKKFSSQYAVSLYVHVVFTASHFTIVRTVVFFVSSVDRLLSFTRWVYVYYILILIFYIRSYL